MIKIDLHLHTLATSSDSHFEFNISKLQEYVTQLEINCIAITNHNIFDYQQYLQICEDLEILVLPGIEIDLEGGHLLLIGDSANASSFADKCQEIFTLFEGGCAYITVDQLKHVFGDLSPYLLIPHYDKKPIVSDVTLAKLTPHIQAGEVASIKKFISCIKDVEKLIPVLFSDVRFSNSLNNFPVRQTWVDLGQATFRGIKACLSDRSKVFLSKEDGNDIFQVTEDGIMLSTGLNVILGERSSGKTYTLERIFASIENIKYIKQFSLLQNDNEKFEELTSVRQCSISEIFLGDFKEVVDDVQKVDLKQNEIDLNSYVTSLLKYASEHDREDSYSKAALFGESPFTELNLSGLTNLIDAVCTLIENTENRAIIEKHVPIEGLKSLATELILKLRNAKHLNAQIKWLNALIRNIQGDLQLKSSCTYPQDVDFYRIMLEKKKVDKFNRVVNLLKLERQVDSREMKGFKITATTRPFIHATHMKEKYKGKARFQDAYHKYDQPYEFLKSLKEIDALPQTDYYKYFVDVEYKTLNRHGYQVSGGERSEFNLLHEISDALQYDALLIDEPESSFDNIFLKNEVNDLLKDIAKVIPVIVVTHNSTVGASIQPDWVVYTQKDLSTGAVTYKVFYGRPSDKELKAGNGEIMNNYQVTMNCLEAGENAYHDRRIKSYEILKN